MHFFGLRVINFMICFTLTFSMTAFSREAQSVAEEIDQIEFFESNGSVEGTMNKYQEKLLKKIDKRIKKAKRVNKPLSEAVSDLEIDMESTYVKVLKAKKHLEKKRVMKRLIRKAKKANLNLSKEDVAERLRLASDRKTFEEGKQTAINLLKKTGSEVKYLQNLKSNFLDHIKRLSSNKTKGSVSSADRSVASLIGGFFVILGGILLYVGIGWLVLLLTAPLWD